MSWYTDYKKSLKMVEVEEIFDLIFYRPLALIVVKIIYPTNITPNQLTIASIICGICAGITFATGIPMCGLYGALFFMAYNILDCSDGQLARLKKNGTYAGRIVDGIADYISATAVFVGLMIGYPDKHYPFSTWCLLLLATGLSNIIQSMLVDYYRNRFLDYVLERKSTFKEDMDSFRQEYDAIKDQKNKWFDRWVISAYFRYSSFQDKLTSKSQGEKLFKATPQNYYKKNKAAIRMWVLIGPTSQVTVLMICTAINRFDILFWLLIGLFNVIALIIWLIQKNIDKSLKANGNA